LKTSANGEKKHRSGFMTRISAVNYAGASETTNGVHPRRTVGTATTTRILLSTKLDPIAERRRPPWSHRTESILKEAPKTPCTVPGRSADSGIPIPTTKANHPTYRTRELMALRKSPLSQETFKWITPRDEAKRRITFPQLPSGTTTIGVLDRVKMVSTAPATYSLLPTPFNSAGHANCRKVSMCQPLRTTNEKCLKLPRISMSAQEIVRHYGMLLSNYELCEIKDYKDIWYFGQRCRKKPYCPDSGGKNFGFDDEKGGYNVIPHDHMAYRYEILDHLGKGSFGRVVRAYDHRQHMQVAVKIIRNKSKFHKQAKTEVKILRLLQKDTTANENTVKMLDHFVFRRHPCIVHELLGKNLYDVLKANHFRGFYMSHIRKITLCILRCLLMLHEKGIIHCDLKPENILLIPGSQCEVKIVDFGSSCKKTEVLYNYIQSRFYRAPEVILGIPYGLPIDMWSLGCILPELLTGKPLFPGQDEFDQICCCVELLGLPPKSLLKDASRRNIFFGNI
uniref:dual-specificity kinase n=1 Tax=Schistocephalus solidus TaxID=70667 RepID=A0A183ST26_SCHSO